MRRCTYVYVRQRTRKPSIALLNPPICLHKCAGPQKQLPVVGPMRVQDQGTSEIGLESLHPTQTRLRLSERSSHCEDAVPRRVCSDHNAAPRFSAKGLEFTSRMKDLVGLK